MTRSALLLLVASGCSLEATTEEEVEEPPWTVAELRSQAVDGQTVTLDEVVITSSRTALDTAFYVQDPGGGAGSGMRVDLGGILFGWPPPVGSLVRITGYVLQDDDGPRLLLEEVDDTEVLGEREPVPVPWEEAPLGYDLVTGGPVRVTSASDPAGRADTDGPFHLGGTFGFTPGYDTEGIATGILEGDRLSLRGPHDWTGSMEGAPPIHVTVSELRAGALPDGTPVVVDDVLQIAGWSTGGRWAVVQEADGEGLWVDAEGWGVAGATGAVGSWVGEVRTDDGGLRLRVWAAPEITGARLPLTSAELRDGQLVELTVSDLTGPDVLGEWQSEGLVLDDRFVPLVDLPDPVRVRGVVRETGGEVALAVTEVVEGR